MTSLTALIIQNNDSVRATQAGPDQNGKFAGWITLGEEDRFRPLISTEPIYDSAKEALDAMTNLIEATRKSEPVRF